MLQSITNLILTYFTMIHCNEIITEGKIKFHHKFSLPAKYDDYIVIDNVKIKVESSAEISDESDILHSQYIINDGDQITLDVGSDLSIYIKQKDEIVDVLNDDDDDYGVYHIINNYNYIQAEICDCRLTLQLKDGIFRIVDFVDDDNCDEYFINFVSFNQRHSSNYIVSREAIINQPIYFEHPTRLIEKMKIEPKKVGFKSKEFSTRRELHGISLITSDHQ